MFRKAAIEASRSRQLGDVIIAQPPSSKMLTLSCATVAFVSVAIFVAGSYTQRTSVIGRLMPERGVVKVSSPFAGTITEKYVSDGQPVKVGDKLYIVSGEIRDGNGSASLAASIQHVAERKHQLMEELVGVENSQRIELRQWSNRLSSQSKEVEKYHQLISAQFELVRLARNSARRYQQLKKLNAVSIEQAEGAQADFHEKQSRLYILEREGLVASGAQAETEEILAAMPHRHRQERSRLKKQLAEVSQELISREAAREFAVTAPVDGTVTAIVAQIGQRVTESKSLASIVPEDQHLEAHLYVQSHAVGYLKPDAPVSLRYQAFPYQRHGMQRGRILSVSETSSPHEDISDIDPYGAKSSGPLYLVKVRLEQQWINGHRGEIQRLRAGMLLEANVTRETRRLYEWALVPFLRLKDKL